MESAGQIVSVARAIVYTKWILLIAVTSGPGHEAATVEWFFNTVNSSLPIDCITRYLEDRQSREGV